MTAGQRIIEGLINGGILQSFCAHCVDHDIVTSFNINAAEQIEALVWDVLNTPSPKVMSESTPIGELMAAPPPTPQPNGCNCYATAPTVPVFRDANDHLAGCPAKDIEAMKRVMYVDADRMRELEAVCGELARALEWLIQEQGVEHNQGCPEDDTCECPHVAKINAAISAFDRAQKLSPHTSTQTNNP